MTKELLTKIKEIEEKLGQDWMNKLDDLKTAEELKKKAAELDIKLSDELAEEALKLLNDGANELSEEELSTIAGGPKYF